MQYERFGETIVLRLDPGEEILSSVQDLCRKEAVALAQVNGLGAVGEAEIGVFDPQTKIYHTKHCCGSYEIASLTGNITRQQQEPYLHLHAVLGNVQTGECWAGHLNRAVISVTAELFLTVLPGEIQREMGPVGIRQLQFSHPKQ